MGLVVFNKISACDRQIDDELFERRRTTSTDDRKNSLAQEIGLSMLLRRVLLTLFQHRSVARNDHSTATRGYCTGT